MIIFRKVYRLGELREVKKFVFWPKTLNGVTIYFQYATICQRYGYDKSDLYHSWNDEWFVDESKLPAS